MAQEVFINVQERDTISDLLQQLKSDSSGLFGTMTPQHMIEHLLETVEISAGKKRLPLAFPIEKAERIKAAVIQTNHPLPQGFRSPLLPAEGLAPLKYSDLAAAVQQFEQALAEFETYFEKHQTNKLINPSLGELGYAEWLVFHNKHFTHHFKQFGLL